MQQRTAEVPAVPNMTMQEYVSIRVAGGKDNPHVIVIEAIFTTGSYRT